MGIFLNIMVGEVTSLINIIYRTGNYMYYTIEGKKLLLLLYFTGILLGSLIINIGIRNGFFHFYDFLDYTSYIASLEGKTAGDLFSYIVMVRIRQLLMFIMGVFIFSPYVTYCLFTSVFSIALGSFISLLVIRFGWTGMLYGLAFTMPQIIFYGIMLFSAYFYIFHNNTKGHFYIMKMKQQGKLLKIHPVMEQKLFVSALCITMFCAGCFSESYLNLFILKRFLPL